MCNDEVMVIVMYSYGISTCSGSTAMMCGTLYAYSMAAGTNGMMDGYAMYYVYAIIISISTREDVVM